MPASTAYELTASGNRVAFHSNRSIFVLDARTGSVRLVAVAAHPPIGLSIEGSRLAWGESLGRRGGVVRAVTVG